MHIGLRIDPSRHLRWHQWLAAALTDAPGCRVTITFSEPARPLPLSCRLLLQLERVIYGHRVGHAMDPAVAPQSEAAGADASDASPDFDLVVDLAGSDDPPRGCGRVLTPLFNGIPGEVGAISAILNGPPVRVEVHDSTFAATPVTSFPAIADARVVTIALDAVLSRTAELIVKAVGEPPVSTARGGHWPTKAYRPGAPATWAALAHVGLTLSGKVTALIGRIVAGGHTWATAYRCDATPSLMDGHPATFAVLRDDRRRYYADPFPFLHRGQRYLFVEEFSFARNQGCISVATLDANGAVSPPRVIIEETHHLSYPLVFEDGGQIWMIPESGAANRIDLYRAEQFPDRWTREGALLEGIAAYDATLTQHDGRLWLLATLARWSSTSWDNLSIFGADRLTGPWSPHAQNPVLLDARHSRSGGALFERRGELLRPVQDCSSVYGGALAFMRVDALSETDFRQSEVGRIECGAFGCHTYNSHGGVEAIDIFGPVSGLAQVRAGYAPVSTTPGTPHRAAPAGEQAAEVHVA